MCCSAVRARSRFLRAARRSVTPSSSRDPERRLRHLDRYRVDWALDVARRRPAGCVRDIEGDRRSHHRDERRVVPQPGELLRPAHRHRGAHAPLTSHAIVALGDSITDGGGAAPNRRWLDCPRPALCGPVRRCLQWSTRASCNDLIIASRGCARAPRPAWLSRRPQPRRRVLRDHLGRNQRRLRGRTRRCGHRCVDVSGRPYS